MLETFTLIIWLYAGLRFAEVRVEGLGRDECVKLLYAAQGSRYLAFRQLKPAGAQPRASASAPMGPSRPERSVPSRCARTRAAAAVGRCCPVEARVMARPGDGAGRSPCWPFGRSASAPTS